jgi:hypothetical protein
MRQWISSGHMSIGTTFDSVCFVCDATAEASGIVPHRPLLCLDAFHPDQNRHSITNDSLPMTVRASLAMRHGRSWAQKLVRKILLISSCALVERRVPVRGGTEGQRDNSIIGGWIFNLLQCGGSSEMELGSPASANQTPDVSNQAALKEGRS